MQLFAIDGTTLIDTDVTGFDGQFTVTGPDAKCVLQVSYGGASERSTVIVGNPPEYVGLPGPAAAFRPDLVSFKAASVGDGQSTYDGSIWYWTPGDFSRTTADQIDVNVVAANGVDLTAGAWIRQSSSGSTFKQGAIGSVIRGAENKNRETVSAGDFGAIADGTLHLLSERYPTLAAAQAIYPFVTDLDQTIDYAALQAGLNAVENKGCLIVPPGHYRIGTDSLIIANYCMFQGMNRGGDDLGFGSLIESDSTTDPILTNKYTANVTFWQVRDLAFRGGGYAIGVFDAVSCSGLVIERIDTRGCAIDDLRFNRMEVSVIRDSFLLSGSRTGYARHIPNFAQNGNRFENNRCSSAGFGAWAAGQGAEGCHWDGGSVEGGGQPGAAAMTLIGDVVPVRACSVRGVYFENIGEFLIRSRGTVEVSLDDNRISGSASPSGALVPSKFDIGASLLSLGDNDWNEGTVGPTPAPLNVYLRGLNSGLSTSRSNVWRSLGRTFGEGLTKARNFTAAPTFMIATMLRESAATDPTNSLSQVLHLHVTAHGIKTGTSTTVIRSTIYEVTILAKPGGGFEMLTPTERTQESAASGIGFALGLSSADTSADLTMAVTGFADGTVASVSCALNYVANPIIPTAALAVVLP